LGVGHEGLGFGMESKKRNTPPIGHAGKPAVASYFVTQIFLSSFVEGSARVKGLSSQGPNTSKK